MAFIMESLSKEDTGQIAEQYQNIFQEKKFWKFSKHASSMVSRQTALEFLLVKCYFKGTLEKVHSSSCKTTVSLPSGTGIITDASTVNKSTIFNHKIKSFVIQSYIKGMKSVISRTYHFYRA